MRNAAKWVILSLIYLLVLPFGWSTKLFYMLFRSSILFNMFAQLFSLLPGLPGSYMRTCFYHQTLKESHLNVEYSFGSVVTKITTSIGRNVYIGLYTSIGYAEIGQGTVMANYISILSGRRQHNFDDPSKPIFADEDVFSMVKVGANCFIGEKVTVMANVGSNTVLGAGAVVVKDLPDFVVAVGNPAKVIKERPRHQKADRVGS